MPVCAQSRICLSTGAPERVHGVGFSSAYKLTGQQWDYSYPAFVRKAGYYTGFIGKYGVGSWCPESGSNRHDREVTRF